MSRIYLLICLSIFVLIVNVDALSLSPQCRDINEEVFVKKTSYNSKEKPLNNS